MLKKFMSYLIVGGIAFVVDAAITLSLALFLHYIVANTVGFFVANIINFILAHKWVFHRKLESADLIPAYVSVLGISMIGLIVSNVSMYVLVDQANMQILLAKIITTLVVLGWNFFGRITFVYSKT
jgi:putative flippase GtrA